MNEGCALYNCLRTNTLITGIQPAQCLAQWPLTQIWLVISNWFNLTLVFGDQHLEE